MANLQTVPHDILVAALDGLRLQEQRIKDQIAQIRSMLEGKTPVENTNVSSTHQRRKFSAAARRKMAAAQKARWARLKRESTGVEAAASKPAKAKRKLSDAARKAIGEATRKRWAAKRGAKVKLTANRTGRKAVGQKRPSARKATARATKKAAPPKVITAGGAQ
jgi:hypothetical protein